MSCPSAGTVPRKRLSGSATPIGSPAAKRRAQAMASASPRGSRCSTNSMRRGSPPVPVRGASSPMSASFPRAVTTSSSSIPLAAHSRATVTSTGSPPGASSSFGAPPVSACMRVPRPPQGITALCTRDMRALSPGLRDEHHRMPPRARCAPRCRTALRSRRPRPAPTPPARRGRPARWRSRPIPRP